MPARGSPEAAVPAHCLPEAPALKLHPAPSWSSASVLEPPDLPWLKPPYPPWPPALPAPPLQPCLPLSPGPLPLHGTGPVGTDDK